MRKKKFILYVTMIAAAAGINLSEQSRGLRRSGHQVREPGASNHPYRGQM